MAIPTGDETFGIILDALRSGKRCSSAQIREYVALHFKTTKGERSQPNGGCPSDKFKNNVAWGLANLGMTEGQQGHIAFIRKIINKPPVYEITEEGVALRKKLVGEITNADLRKF